MRTTLSAAMSAAIFAGAFCLMNCQTVAALPIAAAQSMQQAETGDSLVEPAQFYIRRTRHYIIKCYREFFIGPYRCHRFYRWF